MSNGRSKPEQPKKIIKEEKGLKPTTNPAPMPKVTPPKKESES